MRRPCPDPECCEGQIIDVARWGSHRERSYRQGRTRTCLICGGTGVIDEHVDDLHAAGIFPWGITAEDFRSSPTLTF